LDGDFVALVRSFRKQGFDRRTSIRYAARQDPAGHESYLNACPPARPSNWNEGASHAG
jgi:hypothetical protein